jgi:hypothetical protein
MCLKLLLIVPAAGRTVPVETTLKGTMMKYTPQKSQKQTGGGQRA